MTAKIDTMVQAAAPVTLPLPKSAQATLVPATAARELEREKRRVEHEARVARWKSIGESGGIDAWVRAELKKQGTLVETDPSRLADKDLMGSPHAYAALAQLRASKGDEQGMAAAVKRCEEMTKSPAVCKVSPAAKPAEKPGSVAVAAKVAML